MSQRCAYVRLLPVLVALAGGLSRAAAQAPGERAARPASTQPATAPATRPATSQPKPPLVLRDSDSPLRTTPQVSTTKLLFEMLAYVLILAVLGVVGVMLYRRLGGRARLGGGRRVRTLETTHLGPQRSVHLLQVGERRLLVGSSRENVRFLADVTDATDDERAPASAEPAPKGEE